MGKYGGAHRISSLGERFPSASMWKHLQVRELDERENLASNG